MYRTTDCKIISADKQNVIYQTSESDLHKILSTDLLVRINFGDSTDQIVRAFLIYDTIHCEILSVNSDNIKYFSNEDYINRSIPKSSVLVCYFKNECSIPESEDYCEKFRQMQDYARSETRNIIIRQDGGEIETSGVEIDEKNFYFELYKNDVIIQTLIPRSKVKSFVYSEFRENPSINWNSNYLLSSGGSLRECVITKIDTQKLNLETIVNEKIVDTELDIDKVCALYFARPGIDLKKDVPYQYNDLTVGGETEFKVEFNIGGMWGYRWAPAMENLSFTMEEYINKLRSGFGFGASINFYYSKNYSVGFTYNFMNAHNSIEGIYYYGVISTSDKINVNFFGLNSQYSTIRRNSFSYDIAVAAGYVIYKDNFTINQVDFTIDGRTYGLYFANRFNLLADDDNTGLFLDISFFFSNLNKYNFEDQVIELDEPDNLSRIEIGVGIKFSGK